MEMQTVLATTTLMAAIAGMIIFAVKYQAFSFKYNFMLVGLRMVECTGDQCEAKRKVNLKRYEKRHKIFASIYKAVN